MCVIIQCKDKFPESSVIESAGQLNGDGGGIAWIATEKVKDEKTGEIIDKKYVKWVKGIGATSIIKIIKSGIPLPAIIHFRIATVGSVCEEMCHPFPVSHNASTFRVGKHTKAVLFHNGHWADWRNICLRTILRAKVPFPDGEWSDSRALAWLASIYGLNFLSLIEGSNKIAVLTTEGIRTYGEGWKSVKGNMCSNDFFDTGYARTKFGYWNGDEWVSTINQDTGKTKISSKIIEGDAITDDDILQGEGNTSRYFENAEEYEAIYSDLMLHSKKYLQNTENVGD